MGEGLYESVASFKAKAYERVGEDQLGRHLAEHYGIEVRATAQLDGGVHRIDRADGAPWVARLFTTSRPVEAVHGDAAVLRLVADHDFPAERCIADPVTVHHGQGVLVTEFVDGTNARGDERVELFRTLGAQLGRLHSIEVPSGHAGTRRAGSWHSLSVEGGGRDADVAALCSLLADAATRAPADQLLSFETLRGELESLDVGDGLPTALTHPDYNGANAMCTPGGDVVLVDWTGAGTAPRVSALGLLLSSTGANPTLIDAVLEGYTSTVATPLTAEELDRLDDAIRGFGFVLACWGIVYWGAPASQVAHGVAPGRSFARAIADRARRTVSAGT
jgi:Ser/Thr protein kinase RdoA (MazF antagonist)